MQGFIDRRIPLFLRRLVTMMPALIVLAIGVDATDSSSSRRWCCRSASRSRSCR